ncbi:hypothetical protein C8046_10715 [Serinibacter arcticus]|uniref:Lipoprotein n=1 Tax=Serinibacter arcticus TaxID=1655435 RepID=A0A2U1ZVT2_9MICO|nr:hypothetical protein C8046_10715 [Serinibacter arcticus]
MAAGLAAALAVGLAGCGTNADLEEAAAWFAEVEDADGFVGGGLTGVPASAEAGSDIGVIGPQVTQAFDEPIAVASVNGRCFGGGQITVYLSVSRSAGEHSSESAVTCDGESHELARGRTDVVGLAFGGWTSERSTTYYAVLVDEVA